MTLTITEKPKRNLGPIADFVFVVLLPIICFAIDPVLLINASESVIFAAYVFIPTLMVCFYLTFKINSDGFGGSILEGTLLLGSGTALAIGIVLLPLTLIGLLLLIGILGFIPFLTASRFFRRYKSYRNTKPDNASHAVGIVLGLMIPLILPSALHHFIENRQTDNFSKLSSREHDTSIKVISGLAETWYCQASCAAKISSMFEQGKINLSKQDISPFFQKKVGLTYDAYLEKLERELD